MEKEKDNIKKKAEIVLKNKGDLGLAQIEATIEIVDKLENVVEMISEHHQEMMNKPEKEMPEVSLEETNNLLKELTEEVKKKEEYTYDIEIDPALKAQLKGDKGDTVYVDKVIEKTEVIRELPMVTNEIVEVAKYEEPEQIRDKLEVLKNDERLDKKAIKGLEDLLTLDRAVEILDSRTSFLINKINNLPAPNLSTLVPYTGATTDVNLGAHDLTVRNIQINGTYNNYNSLLYDIGSVQNSDLRGYGLDYITDKSLNNVTVGSNGTASNGGMRVTTAGVFQMYLNGSWNNVVTNFVLREDSTFGYTLEHAPIGFTQYIEIMTGQSLSNLGLNGYPITNAYKTSQGAYPPVPVIGGYQYV